jgi:hypothetical protein
MCTIVTRLENNRASSQTKLTKQKATEILMSKENVSVLANLYKVSKSTIHGIKARRRWTN